MPQSQNNLSSVDAVEVLPHGFDFSSILLNTPNLTITSVESLTLTTLPGSIGSDPTPQDRIVSSATISGMKVFVWIGPCLPNVIYEQSCQVLLSDGTTSPRVWQTFNSLP